MGHRVSWAMKYLFWFLKVEKKLEFYRLFDETEKDPSEIES